jgi:hypothetical protein
MALSSAYMPGPRVADLGVDDYIRDITISFEAALTDVGDEATRFMSNKGGTR